LQFANKNKIAVRQTVISTVPYLSDSKINSIGHSCIIVWFLYSNRPASKAYPQKLMKLKYRKPG